MFIHRNALYALTLTLATFASPSIAAAEPWDGLIIDQAVEMLAKTKAGASSAKYLKSGRVAVKFARCNVILNKPVAACFTYNNKSIYLSPSLRDAPIMVVAAFLVHEATHASRADRTSRRFLKHSHARDHQRILIDEEMIAYQVQARVWRELRAREGALARIFVTDPWVASMDKFTGRLLASDENQRRNYISAALGYAKEFRRWEKAALSPR